MKRGLEPDQVPQTWERWQGFVDDDFEARAEQDEFIGNYHVIRDPLGDIMGRQLVLLDATDPVYDRRYALSYDHFNRRMANVKRYLDTVQLNAVARAAVAARRDLAQPRSIDLLVYYIYTGQVDAVVRMFMLDPLSDLFSACPFEPVPSTDVAVPRRRFSMERFANIVDTVRDRGLNVYTWLGFAAALREYAYDTAPGDEYAAFMEALSDTAEPMFHLPLNTTPSPDVAAHLSKTCQALGLANTWYTALTTAAFERSVTFLRHALFSAQDLILYAIGRSLANQLPLAKLVGPPTLLQTYSNRIIKETFYLGMVCSQKPGAFSIVPLDPAPYRLPNLVELMLRSLPSSPQALQRAASTFCSLFKGRIDVGELHATQRPQPSWIDFLLWLPAGRRVAQSFFKTLQTSIAYVRGDPVPVLRRQMQRLAETPGEEPQAFRARCMDIVTRTLPASQRWYKTVIVPSSRAFDVDDMYVADAAVIRLEENPAFAANATRIRDYDYFAMAEAFPTIDLVVTPSTLQRPCFFTFRTVAFLQFFATQIFQSNLRDRICLFLLTSIDMERSSDDVLRYLARFVTQDVIVWRLDRKEIDLICTAVCEPRFLRIMLAQFVEDQVVFTSQGGLGLLPNLQQYDGLYPKILSHLFLHYQSYDLVDLLELMFDDYGFHPWFTSVEGYRLVEQFFWVESAPTIQEGRRNLRYLTRREKRVYALLTSNPEYVRLLAADT